MVYELYTVAGSNIRQIVVTSITYGGLHSENDFSGTKLASKILKPLQYIRKMGVLNQQLFFHYIAIRKIIENKKGQHFQKLAFITRYRSLPIEIHTKQDGAVL